MSQLQWSADWATGFHDIDEQHQNLIEQFTQLQQARTQNDAMHTMQALFDFIASAMNHFSYEEEMLNEANYNMVDTRHKTHQNFTDRLISYQDRIFEDATVLDELLPQIEMWLNRHITLNDRAYIAPVQASGIYQKNQQGQLIRPSMNQTMQGAFQEELNNTPSNEPENNTETSTSSDTPRGWAGTY